MVSIGNECAVRKDAVCMTEIKKKSGQKLHQIILKGLPLKAYNSQERWVNCEVEVDGVSQIAVQEWGVLNNGDLRVLVWA